MKKIGIITVHRLPNWGSALQGYALQKVVESLGFACECINYLYPNPWHVERGSWKRSVPPMKTRIARMLGLRAPSLQQLVDKFVNSEIKESRTYNTFDDIHNNPPLYDIYMSGSDQIWNWRTMCADPTYLLDFAPEDKPKIAYSSSFSVNYIPENLKEMYAKCLSEYKSLSVRESNGSRLIKELIGEDAPVVLDPTLLLNNKQWRELASKARWKQAMPDKYILSYMLNYTFNPKPAMTALLHRLQKRYQCPVIMLGRPNDMFDGDIFQMSKLQGIGVYEFLWLISHASVVASSSFHGSAFAVNMGVPLLALVEKVDQEDDRIPSFLSSVGLSDNLVTINTDFDNLDKDGSYDAESAQKKLDMQRLKSIQFIKDSIK